MQLRSDSQASAVSQCYSCACQPVRLENATYVVLVEAAHSCCDVRLPRHSCEFVRHALCETRSGLGASWQRILSSDLASAKDPYHAGAHGRAGA